MLFTTMLVRVHIFSNVCLTLTFSNTLLGVKLFVFYIYFKFSQNVVWGINQTMTRNKKRKSLLEDSYVVRKEDYGNLDQNGITKDEEK